MAQYQVFHKKAKEASQTLDTLLLQFSKPNSNSNLELQIQQVLVEMLRSINEMQAQVDQGVGSAIVVDRLAVVRQEGVTEFNRIIARKRREEYLKLT